MIMELRSIVSNKERNIIQIQDEKTTINQGNPFMPPFNKLEIKGISIDFSYYYSGHLNVLISCGGVADMFSPEIISHDMRLLLAFTQIAP
jgi:hypothetical protein